MLIAAPHLKANPKVMVNYKALNNNCLGTTTSKSTSKSSYRVELLPEENSSNPEPEENKSIDEESKDRNRNGSKSIKLINKHSNKTEINRLSNLTWKDTESLKTEK